MALPYPTKVVLPFDIATAQDMNERHANDVALANGSGLDDGAVTADKVDLATFEYTTAEQVVGKWIDGKTVYRKVVNYGSLPNNTSKDVPHNISDLDEVIMIYGMARNAGTHLPLSYSSTSALLQFYIFDAYIRCQTNSNRASFNAYVIIEYTKA